MIRIFRNASILMALLIYCVVSQASPVWFSDKQGVNQVDAGTNQATLNLALDQVAALGINSRDGAAWALSAASLVKYAANGSLLLQINLNTLANDFGNSRLLSVDSFDGSVWLAGNKRLLHLDRGGVTLSSLVAPDVIQDITVGQDETLWILGQTQLLHYSPQGVLLSSLNLSAAMQKSKYLAVDDAAHVIWLAGDKQLYQLNQNQPSQTQLMIALGDVTAGIAINPQDSSLWIAGQNTLTSYALNGGLLHTTNLQLYKAITNPIAMVFDYGSNAFWLGHVGGVSRFDMQGNYLATVPADVQVKAVGKSIVIPIPVVNIMAPPANALTNNPNPTVQLGYDAVCAGQPCHFPNSYYSGYKLSALINNQQMGPSFVYNPVDAQSAYTPSSRLPEGLNTIVAQVTDQHGVTSDLVTSSFTIDTIPPKFLTISPADQLVSSVPQIAFTGSLDDPQATLVYSNNNTSDNAISQILSQQIAATGGYFNYLLTLKLGVNAITLAAIDHTGNVATKSVTYTYSPITVTLDSPLPNAVIDANKVTVTGTFAGAASATISVNGVNAIVTGNSYAATVPLVYGSNTLTATATAPNGAIATQSITVTSTYPSISITSPSNGSNLNDNTALVTGIVKVPANTNFGIVVNGVIALVDANNRFYANNVPMQAGSNTITATITTLKGQSNTSSTTVTATGYSPISIMADQTQGFGPLTVAFTASSNTGNKIVSWQASTGAAGTLDTSDPTVLFKFTYTQPGFYQANVTATDSLGQSYNKIIVIQVQDLVQMDAMFKAMWNGMNNALIAGDKATAMIYLNAGAQSKYGPVFDALMPNFSKIIASYSSLQRTSLSSSFGEYAIRRPSTNGGYRIYLIYFLLGTDGIWRVDEM